MAFGVSNSFKRGTVKTYTKQRAYVESLYEADGRPHKRICMSSTGHVIEKIQDDGQTKIEQPTQEATGEQEVGSEQQAATKDRASSMTRSSSPPAADNNIFSPTALSSDSELSSLPSSPPPMPSPIPVSRKPTFSFLKRKSAAIEEDQDSRTLSPITANSQKGPKPSKKAMTQMQIDLGGDVRKRCRACGMEYIPSVKEDATIHKEFCGMNTGGIEMGKPFLKDESVKKIRSKKLLSSEKEAIVVIDQRCSVGAKHKAKKAFDIVNAELNAVPLADDTLWSEGNGDSGEKQSNSKRKGFAANEKKVERFKAFLHLANDRCVGFCLAEKISHAYPVISDETSQQKENLDSSTSKSSSISHSTSAQVMLLGISRIWTSKSYRGQGIASNLLECARSNFFFGVEIPRHLVAFSQPTESGGRLARRWFDAESGWHVYSGDQA